MTSFSATIGIWSQKMTSCHCFWPVYGLCQQRALCIVPNDYNAIALWYQGSSLVSDKFSGNSQPLGWFQDRHLGTRVVSELDNLGGHDFFACTFWYGGVLCVVSFVKWQQGRGKRPDWSTSPLGLELWHCLTGPFISWALCSALVLNDSDLGSVPRLLVKCHTACSTAPIPHQLDPQSCLIRGGADCVPLSIMEMRLRNSEGQLVYLNLSFAHLLAIGGHVLLWKLPALRFTLLHPFGVYDLKLVLQLHSFLL